MPVVLAAWLTVTLAMSYVASGNFRVVEPGDLRNAAEVFDDLPDDGTRRMKLRYVASELNRYYFWRYDRLNLGLAVLAVVLVAGSGARPRGSLLAVTLCLLVSLSFTLYFTPTLIEQGRAIDFVVREPERPPEVATFYRIHGANIGLELLKLGMIGIVLVGWLRARPATTA